MRLFNRIDILKSSDVDRMKNLHEIVKSFQFGAPRPRLPFRETYGMEGVRIPVYPVDKELIYDMAHYSDTLRTIIISLREEIFRQGLELEEKFVQKCVSCGKEYDHQEEDRECDECGGTEFTTPDIKQKDVFEHWKKSCNQNDQTMEEVLKMIEDDLNIIDNAYLLVSKRYVWNSDGSELVGAKKEEIIRCDPRNMEIICDKTGKPGRNDEGAFLFTCIEHRKEVWTDRLICPHCGKPLFKAYFKGKTLKDAEIHYIKGEIIHITKYTKSLTYGFPPVITVWQKTLTLLEQDKYIKEFYTRGRPPGVLLFVRGVADSIAKAWKWMLDTFRENPHQVVPIPVEDSKGKTMVEKVDFSKTLQEMEWIDAREEFRRVIGAVYGVMPLFTGQAQGGLAQQGLEITVTNRAVERGQEIHNRKLLPFIAEQLGITDYNIILEISEPMDEITEQRIEAQKIQNAVAMKGMGFTVELNEENEFEFSRSPEEPEYPEGGMQGEPSVFPGPEQQRFSGEPESIQRSLTPQPIILTEKEKIDRTEEQARQTKQRAENYLLMDGSENFKYKWIGPNDDRTTDICRNIKRRTTSGVSLKRLREIIRQEGRKGGFEIFKENPYTPHINCRHTLIRVI